MKSNSPDHIGAILDAMQQTTPLGDALEHAQIWEHWEELAGAHLARHCRPHRVKGMVLHILAESPVWMHKMSFVKWNLIRRINRMARKELISDVFFVLAPDGDAMKDEE